MFLEDNAVHQPLATGILQFSLQRPHADLIGAQGSRIDQIQQQLDRPDDVILVVSLMMMKMMMMMMMTMMMIA